MIEPFLLLAIPLLQDLAAAHVETDFALGPSQDVENEGPPMSAFNYDYVEASLAFGDLDGFRLGGSLHLEGPWIVLGRFEFLTEDEGAADVDITLLSGGLGYVYPAERNLDFVGSAEIEVGESEVDNPAGSVDDDDIGIRLRAGARFEATAELELAGGLSVTTIFDEDLGADGRALYAFDEHLSGFVGFESRDDTFLVLGVRYGF